MSFPTFNGAAGEDAQEFLDNLEIACLVTGRDDDATRLRVFPLLMKAEEKVWFNTLLPANRGNWAELRVLFLAKFGGGGETSESLWGKVCELRQGSLFEYNVYEVQFVELWERWVASLRLGEAAPDFLKKDRFVAGLYPPLREKVKGRFAVTWMDARDIAHLKERKIRYQLQQREADQEEEGMAPVSPTNAPVAHRGQGNQDQQELLSRITHQLEDLSLHLVRGGRGPPPNQEQARGPRRQAQEYHCYNCGENGHGMYYCPHPRRIGNFRGPRNQVSPPRERQQQQPPFPIQQAPLVQILRPPVQPQQQQPPPPPPPIAPIPPLPVPENRAVNVISLDAKVKAEEEERAHEKKIEIPKVKVPPPPPKVIPNAYTLFFDGAFRRGVGKARGGLVLLDPEGKVDMEETLVLTDSLSNNEAEFDILILRLKACISRGIKRLMVKGDALLVVKQVMGVWACKSEKLKGKVRVIRSLLSQFSDVQLYHIPRKENQQANDLAQRAVKEVITLAAASLKPPRFEGLEALAPIVSYILEGEFSPGLTSLQQKQLIKQASSYLWLDGVLYQKGKDLVCRRVPSCKEIPLILKSLREEACGGHFTHDLTAEKILHAGYVWPTLHLDVQHWCRTCHQCQINGDRRLVHGPRHPVVANGPFEKWGIDAIGRLPRTADGKLYILVAIDYMTKWVEAQSVSRVTKRTVSKFVYSHICCRFGAPQEIILDHGPGFREGLLMRVCEEMKVKHQHATPYYPQSNGAVEKANGFTPFHLVYGQEALQPIELEIPTIRAIKNEGKTEEEILADECVKWVLLDNKHFLSVETFDSRQ
ncbi:hypothetical protein L7F22_060831 [Adiantum nelumboides]|nr:hypothetical protein [Adiantum nelumboides]